jgi:hypothetical protein
MHDLEESLPEDDEGPVALSFLTYRLHEPLIHYLQLASEVLSRRIGRPEIQSAIFAVGRVMTLNSLRANVKEVIFRENGFRPEDTEHYRNGLRAFRMALTAGHRNVFSAFTPRFRELDLPVELVLCQRGDGAVLNTINRFALGPNDENTIHRKLARARGNYELFQLFEEGENDPSSHETIYRAAAALDDLGLRPRLEVSTDRDRGRTVASLEVGCSDLPATEPTPTLTDCSPLAFQKVFEGLSADPPPVFYTESTEYTERCRFWHATGAPP